MNAGAASIPDDTSPALSTTQWLAWLLVIFSVTELVILRIGTRTAVHIPDIQQLRGPYDVFAMLGRLAFYSAAVALAVYLGCLVLDLVDARRTNVAACIVLFSTTATLGALGVVGNSVIAPITVGVVLALATATYSYRSWPIGIAIAAFAMAFGLAGSGVILNVTQRGLATGVIGEMTLRAEQLAVLAAIASGPLVRRALGLGWLPSRRVALIGVGSGLFVAAAILANPSTMHILMLWNFGLTGSLPAPLYGLAAGSFVVGVVSALRHGEQALAAALLLLCLGGVGLISTYQSGLVVAGLAGVINMSQPRETELPPDLRAQGVDIRELSEQLS